MHRRILVSLLSILAFDYGHLHAEPLPHCQLLLAKFAVFSGPMAKLVAAPLLVTEIAQGQLSTGQRQELTLIAEASAAVSSQLEQSLQQQHFFSNDPYRPAQLATPEQQSQTRSLLNYYKHTHERARSGIPLEITPPTALHVPMFSGNGDSPFFAEHMPPFADKPAEFQLAININRFQITPLHDSEGDMFFTGYQLSLQEDTLTQGAQPNSLLKLAAGLTAMKLEGPERNNLRFASNPIPIVLERSHPDLASLPIGEPLSARYWFFRHPDGRILDFGLVITPIIRQ